MTSRSVLTALALAATTTASPALAETLSCKLYVTVGSVLGHSVEVPVASTTIGAERYGGTCHFADGTVAEKQFVMIRRTMDGGAKGRVHGYSIYAFNDADSLTLEYVGGWGADGFSGDYAVASGSGRYEDAAGTGSFTATGDAFKGVNVFDVVIDLE